MNRVVATCKSYDVPVGHPHVDTENVARVIEEGYRFLMAAPVRSYTALETGRNLSGRV
jgi:4-hydroxy-2-oxoheptanedioate aldolase